MSSGRYIISLSVLLLSIMFFSFKWQETEKRALVKFVIGNVEAQSKLQTTWRNLTLNENILEGDRIKTALNSRVELSMPDGSVLRINENTIFDVNEIKDAEVDKEDKFKFTLWAGNIWAQFKKIVTTRQVREIESPSAVVAIRGTTLELDVDQNQNTLVRVEEGRVSVKSKDITGEVLVGANQETFVERGSAPTEPRGYQRPDRENETTDFSFSINLPSYIFTDPSVLLSGIPVSGQLAPNARLLANERPLPVAPNGSYNSRIPVIEGLNTINLVAEKNQQKKSREIRVFVNTKKPEIKLSTPLVAGFYNRRDYSLSGGVFDLTPDDKVKVFINNEEVAEVMGSGSFNRTVILKEGANIIRVMARDRSGNTQEISQRLFLDTVNPILTITDPAQQVLTRYQPPPPPTRAARLEQKIRGLVIDPEPSSGIKRITVNGREIKPNSNGTFETTIRLKPGENRLNFNVEDLAGNIHRNNTRVIRVPR
jgi:hypothetical protein